MVELPAAMALGQPACNEAGMLMSTCKGASGVCSVMECQGPAIAPSVAVTGHTEHPCGCGLKCRGRGEAQGAVTLTTWKTNVHSDMLEWVGEQSQRSLLNEATAFTP